MKLTDYLTVAKQYQGKRIPYAELLKTHEWYDKREIVIRRDAEKCTNCGNKTTEYLLGHHVWWYDYFVGVKQPNDQFWEKWDYYEKLLGDQFVGLSPVESEYEIIPEASTAAILINKQYYLQVHHKFYVEGRLPWEYSDEDLVTLCNWCHFELHQRELIPVYVERDGKLIKKTLTPCPRCNGAGFLPEYKHVENGICFNCKGAKFKEYIIKVDLNDKNSYV